MSRSPAQAGRTGRSAAFLAVSRAEMLVVPRRALASAAAFAGLSRYARAKVDAAVAGR
jgi:hypothetical protein